MGDYHVRMMFQIDATPAEVRAALAGSDRISTWWSDKVEGAASDVGDEFRITFPDAPAPFELEVKTADEATVEWTIDSVPPWWAGTTIRFDVMPAEQGDGANLMFQHRDFDAGNEVIPIITPAWAQIVMRLKEVVETGEADAFFKP